MFPAIPIRQAAHASVLSQFVYSNSGFVPANRTSSRARVKSLSLYRNRVGISGTVWRRYARLAPPTRVDCVLSAFKLINADSRFTRGLVQTSGTALSDRPHSRDTHAYSGLER